MALNINGRMKVKTLRADFKKEFGLTLRVYDGRSFADDDSTLASIRKGDSKGGEFAPRKNTKVGNLEDKIMEMFGIKTQVAGSDDSYLCNNDLTLTGALESDQKKVSKKESKGLKFRESNAESKEKKPPSEVEGGMVDVKISICGKRITTFSFACLDDKYVEDIEKAIEFTEGLDEEEFLGRIFESIIADDFDELKSEIDMDEIEENCPKLHQLLNNLENSDWGESDKIEALITPYPEPILYMEAGHSISITVDGETKVDNQPLGEFLGINDEAIELDEIEDEENSVVVQKAKKFCNVQEDILGIDSDSATVYKCDNGMMLIESWPNQPELVKMLKNKNQITISGEVNGYVNYYLSAEKFDLDKLTFVRNSNYDEWIGTDIVGNYFCYDNKIIEEYDFDQHNLQSIRNYDTDGFESLTFYLEG